MPAMRSREETATVVFALLIYNIKLLFVAREDPSEEKEKSSDAEELHLDADVVFQQAVREADRQDDEADQLKQASEECAHGSPLTRRFAPPSPRKRGEGPPPVALRPACGEKVPEGRMRGRAVIIALPQSPADRPRTSPAASPRCGRARGRRDSR